MRHKYALGRTQVIRAPIVVRYARARGMRMVERRCRCEQLFISLELVILEWNFPRARQVREF